MRNISMILACFFFLSAYKTNTHEFYLSVTEMEYQEDEESLQIITRVFTDDFENVLRKRFDDDIRLSHEGEDGPVTASIEKYLAQKLHLTADEKNLQLNFLGKEYDADQVVMYIEVENLPAFSSIKVNNAVLTDLFDDQKNVVHVKVKGKTKSLLLVRDEPEKVLNF